MESCIRHKKHWKGAHGFSVSRKKCGKISERNKVSSWQGLLMLVLYSQATILLRTTSPYAVRAATAMFYS